jgi:hypothetical protein
MLESCKPRAEMIRFAMSSLARYTDWRLENELKEIKLLAEIRL